MPYGVFVPMRRETKERLLELARSERRQPHDQAAVILERAIAEKASADRRDPEPKVA